MLRWIQRFFGFKADKDRGAEGEERAAEWLRRNRGFVVIARNWRDPADRRREIDLVCRDGEILVFIEVKARSAGALVPGYFAVDDRKKRILRRAIDAYLFRLRPAPQTFRFDVVEITHQPADGSSEVRHFENIPLFAKHYRR
jgi:putative endonuclease